MKRLIRTIVVGKRSRCDVLHVEAPNGIINIRWGLSDCKGRAVDSIEVIPDAGCTVSGYLNTRIIRKAVPR